MLERNKKIILIAYFAIVSVVSVAVVISLTAHIPLKKIFRKNRSSIGNPDMDKFFEYQEKIEKTPKIESELQKQLIDYIDELKAKETLSEDDVVAIYVFDIVKGERLAGIDESKSLQAASMIKPLIALAFFHQVKYEGLQYTEECKRKMEAMIQRSRNGSANWIIEKIGGPEKVQEILETNYGMILTKTEIVEYIPIDGKTYLNKASALDYGRFLYSLWNELLPSSSEILRLMAMQNSDTVSRGIKGMPRGMLVYDKTGSTGQVTGDIAILVGQDKKGSKFPYIMICVIQCHTMAPNYTIWHRKTKAIIRDISSKVYAEMKKTYGLM